MIPPYSSKTYKVARTIESYFQKEEKRRDLPNGYLETMTIYTANLHMHSYGARAITYILDRDGTREVMLEIPDWDLNWQNIFTFEKPIVLNRKNAEYLKMVVECSYQNPQDYPVRGGFGSDDEMCFNFAYTVFR